MYQLSEQQEKENRFAILYAKTVEHGKLELPIMPKSTAHSFRSQLNRYRKQQRGNQHTRLWDLVTNKLVNLGNGQARVIMTYEKEFWDEIDRGLGIARNKEYQVLHAPLPTAAEITALDMNPAGIPSLSTVLDGMFPVGRDKPKE